MLQHGRLVALAVVSVLALAGCQAKTQDHHTHSQHQSAHHRIAPQYPGLYGAWVNDQGDRLTINAKGQVVYYQDSRKLTGQITSPRDQASSEEQETYQFKLSGQTVSVSLTNQNNQSQAGTRSIQTSQSLILAATSDKQAGDVFYKEEMTISLKN